MSAAWTMACNSRPLRVYQDMALLAFNLLAGVIARRIDREPFFRALDALAVDDCRRRIGLALGKFPAFHAERVVDPIERAVFVPAAEIIVHPAAGRQILWQPVLRMYMRPLTIA